MELEVIIPLYNCSHLIEKCLLSLKEQSIEHRILIIDDASIDDSLEKSKKYRNDHLVLEVNSKNLGNLKTINKLLAKTTSDFIAFQDADDWSHKDRFSKQIQFIKNNELDFCFTNYVKTEANGKDELYCGGVIDNTIINLSNAVEIEPCICFASIIFKRKVYEKIGGFDIYFDRIGAADIDWYYRAIISGFKGGVVKFPLYYYRNNHASFTNSISLDKRKYISLEIARFFFNFRKSNENNNPSKKELQNLIRNELSRIKFDQNKNLRDFIAQQAIRRNYFVSVYYLIFAFVKSPLRVINLKLLKFILSKIMNRS